MTISQSLQAFGILLEILGLVLAYVKFGSADELWFKKMQPEINALQSDPEKEVFDFRVQIFIILIGLTLQLIGLFVT